ncbi:THUMP domain-containing class I SAM-dependent RNA methyltransferase [Pelagibacterium lacus]|uniref:Class I SAM-dependent RNA methyltransferase n=1 Tax=Pelagibacterium lacus TaxID=2282655 RepID=A0A369W7V9_9HYPH|nr:class I SAM-dependent RNA methyltransferase [Pelagibacterium lacus]RDE08141.1 class I SAM-dependent RNA methyltransferase [Pelagibacterium lacus]
MTHSDPFEIFLVAAPGLEAALRAEAVEAGFPAPEAVTGGVVLMGGWPEIWRANYLLRGAVRVLARIARFPVTHLAQLDKKARRVDWAGYLPAGAVIAVEASCRKSKIYHSGAAAQRIEGAIIDAIGAQSGKEGLRVMVRIENDLCTLSLDTSGAPLHKRGAKPEVNAAPMRETTAALLLRQCGYRGTEPVLDPMCGSGTFVIEAAEMARRLAPGRARAFAFEHFRSFNPEAFAAIRSAHEERASDIVHRGSDRDAGAIRMSLANAERAGVSGTTAFLHMPVKDLERPDSPPGLVIVNPPFGARLGSKGKLGGLYAALGNTLLRRFSGWRVGLVATDAGLVRATGLPFHPPGQSIDNNGLRIALYRTDPLP